MCECQVVHSELNDVPLESKEWKKANVIDIDLYPWKKENSYSPITKVRMLYGEIGITLCFEVCEENIVATFTKPNDPVCRDSCVEFFFTPNLSDKKYLSFEINPLGALLIGISTSGSDLQYIDTNRNIFKIETSLQENHWKVKYIIPYSFIMEYFSEISKEFRCNFMKCADGSITPHHGCWNEIKTEIPMFHVPQYFGKITFKEDDAPYHTILKLRQ